MIQLLPFLLYMHEIFISSGLCDLSSTDSSVVAVITSNTEVSANNSLTCFWFSDIEAAFQTASRMQTSKISLRQINETSIGILAVSIKTQIWVEGNGMKMTLKESIDIGKNGNLTVQNVTVEYVNTSTGFLVMGTIQLMNCYVSNWKVTILTIIGGEVIVKNCRFEGNEGGGINVRDGKMLKLKKSEFVSNSEFMSFVNSNVTQKWNFDISDCIFEGNYGQNVISLSLKSTNPTLSILFSHNRFSGNSALLFNMRIVGLSVTLQSESYKSNSAGGILLSLSNGTLNIQNCTWKNSYFPFLFVTFLSGTVQMSESSMTGQGKSAPIHISNQGETHSCQVSIAHSTFSDSHISPTYQTAGAIFSSKCSVYLLHSDIKNCTAVAPVFSLSYGIVYAVGSYLVISNTSLSDIGGTGGTIGLLLSTVMLESVEISQAKIGGDGVILVAGSSLRMDGVTLIGGVSYSERKYLTYIFIEMSNVELSNVEIRDNPIWFTSGVSVFYSSVRSDNVTISRVRGNAAFISIKSDLYVTNAVCESCDLIYFAGSLGIGGVFYDKIQCVNSTIQKELFISGGGSNISVNSVFMSKCKAVSIISCDFITAIMNDIEVIDSKIDFFAHIVINCALNVNNLVYKRCEGALIRFSSNSKISIFDAEIDSLNSISQIILLQSSNLTLKNSEILTIKSAYFVELHIGCNLEFEKVRISNVFTQKNEVIKAHSSLILLNQSSFMNFNSSLIACDGCIITISETVFANGGFGLERKYGSQSRKGGLIRCSDCSEIQVNFSKISSVSADIGGAIYCETIEQTSALIIHNSSFEGCSAYMGGAAVISNVSFDIQLSDFNGCFSESFGGALDISVSETHFRSIKSTRFIYNSAHEGGAIKWRNAETIIENCIFFNNSAYYGPDFASYDANLSAHFPNSISPGQPFSMSFDLLDHYRQKITTNINSILNLEDTPSITFSGITNKLISEGTFNYSEIELYATPGSTQILKATHKWKHFDANILTLFLQNVSIRDCVPGEIKTINSCRVCNEGYFSLNPTDSDCAICPELASCLGGAVISPHAGAWLTGLHDTPVVACLVKEHCLGSLNNTCSDGYEGPLCNQCEPGWFPLVFTSCWQCAHLSVFVMELITIIFVVLLFYYGIIRYALVRPSEFKLFLLKTVLTHIQYLSILSFVQVSYPPALQVFFRIMLDIATFYSASIPFPCFGRNYYYNIGAAALIGIFALLLAVLFIAARCAYFRSYKLFNQEMPLLASMLISVIPTSVAITSLPLFGCKQIGDYPQLLIVDMSEKCWQGSHLTVICFIITVSFLINFFIPFANTIFSTKFHNQILFEYRNNRYELICFASKTICVCAVILQLSFSSTSQVFISLLILYLLAILNGFVDIYKCKLFLCVAQISHFTLIATFSLLFPIINYDVESTLMTISAVIISINVGFFIVCGVFARYCADSLLVRSAMYQRSVANNDLESSAIGLHGVSLELA